MSYKKILTKKTDLEFGILKETKILPLIKDYWDEDENIMNTKDLYNDPYYKYDFESNKSIWEVKSRRNTKNQYPTTIIPTHKIIETTKDHYLVFNFTDKCSFIEYDEKRFKTFSTKYIKVYRDGKLENPVLHYEIPINLLLDIN
jgi:hypothetical protein